MGVTHSVATVVTDVVLHSPVCSVAQVRPDGGDDERPAGCRSEFPVFVGSGIRDQGSGIGSRSGASCGPVMKWFLFVCGGEVDVGAHRPVLHADRSGVVPAASAQPGYGGVRLGEVAMRVVEGVVSRDFRRCLSCRFSLRFISAAPSRPGR
jgi:hypothetical protein